MRKERGGREEKKRKEKKGRGKGRGSQSRGLPGPGTSWQRDWETMMGRAVVWKHCKGWL